MIPTLTVIFFELCEIWIEKKIKFVSEGSKKQKYLNNES